MKRQRVAVILGTRPEAIKLAPVIQALQRSKTLRPWVLNTGQHAHLVDSALASFGIGSDLNLRSMIRDQSLWRLSSRLMARLGNALEGQVLAAALVQGDTTTAFSGGLCAFYHRIPVGHVEAGLRTGDLAAPFPEELNRSLLARIARWHFAPTPSAVRNLHREGVSSKGIYLTGNTIMDAVRLIGRRAGESGLRRLLGVRRRSRRLIVVTCHRRENFGSPMRSIGRALAALSRRHPELTFVVPIHPNPTVVRTLIPLLRDLANVVLCPPLDYPVFLTALGRADLILTDSGGVQEEATALGRRVLVLRDKTERREGIASGGLRIVGCDERRIVAEAETQLRIQPPAKSAPSEVFGDGRAAPRIVKILESTLQRRPRR